MQYKMCMLPVVFLKLPVGDTLFFELGCDCLKKWLGLRNTDFGLILQNLLEKEEKATSVSDNR